MNHELSFGEVVRERRELLGLTQAELGRRAGCAAITIRKIEADALHPSVQIAERLAVGLGIAEADYLAFVRLARANREPSPLPTPPPTLAEIGLEDLSGRAIRGYQLGERIGSGGYGVVYRAIQTTVNREVAVKIILPQYADRPEFIRRFEAEAHLVARLEHPHIVPLYDYWREPGVAYLVMRLLRGGSLTGLLKDGPLTSDKLLPLLEQICAGLYAAHQAGVIHRDIKPANILLDEAGNAYLADFGIAKNLSQTNAGETMEGMVVGSPAYISPEQIMVEPVKPQSDVYSLGVMLYELLTGHKPFAGPTPFVLIQQHLNQPFPSLALHDLNPQLASGLDSIIQRATAKDQASRYPDIPSLLADFRKAAGEQGSKGAEVISPLPLRTSAPLLDLTNPYKGLRAFSEADAADFFGRETLIQELLTHLAESADLARFLAVVGPSGSGKSSVVKAGLIPALRQGGLPGSEQWFIIEMLPGAHPWEELEAALLRVAVNPPESLLAQLRADERGLLRAVQRVLPADEAVELVLIIDQFEELFTLVTAEAVRAMFLNSLVAAVLDPRSRLRLVITLRADFTGHPLQYMDFGELLRQRTEFVLPLTPDELEQAITGPARRVGLVLEPGLVAAISRDVGDEPGALPLLQYALTELFERSIGANEVGAIGQSPLLTRAAYQASGGVLGALARRADELYTGLDEAGQEAARQLFLRLVTLGEGTEDTRRRVLRAEVEALSSAEEQSSKGAGEKFTPVPPLPNSSAPLLPRGLISNLIDQFGRHRLLSFDHDPITRSPTVEVAHEALLREWNRLREWLAASRNDIRLQRLLATAVAEWREANQDASFLPRGARLDQFAGWAETTNLALTPDERIFLEASLTDREVRRAEEEARQQRELEAAQKLAETERAKAEEQARAAQRLRQRALWLAGALVIAGILAVVAVLFGQQATQNERRAVVEANNRATAQANAETQQKEAEYQARLATVRELAASALSNLEEDPERSILLALQAVTTTYTIDGMVLKEAEEALHQVIPAAHLQLTLRGHTDAVRNVAFSPDGLRLATVSHDKTVKLWDAASGQELLTLPCHTDWVTGVAFSPDGKRLASSSKDKTAKIWDLTTGQELLTLTGHTEWVNKVAFSPDGTRLATASGDKTAKVWDAATGRKLLTLTGFTEEVNDIVFSPDGTRLATSSFDNRVRVWDTTSGQVLFTFTSFAPLSVAFSPDGLHLASNSRTVIKIWDVAADQELLTLAGHSQPVARVTFSPDGTRLASAGYDNTVRLWDIGLDREILNLVAHPPAVDDVTFSPDGTRLASAGYDNTAKIWDVATGQKLLTLTSQDPFFYARFSPDGTRLATSSGGETPAQVWDAATGRKLLTLI